MQTENVENQEISDENSVSVEMEVDSRKQHRKLTKFDISKELKEKLKDLPDVLEYIESLQRYLEKQKRKIRKLRRFKVSLLVQ